MAGDTGRHDFDHTPVLLGTSNIDGMSPVVIWADPITHRLLISGTGGGGGFTTLSANETPNGNRASFTFALAAAQPSFVMSDGVWYTAIDDTGATNWTWSGTVLTFVAGFPYPTRMIRAVV